MGGKQGGGKMGEAKWTVEDQTQQSNFGYGGNEVGHERWTAAMDNCNVNRPTATVLDYFWLVLVQRRMTTSAI